MLGIQRSFNSMKPAATIIKPNPSVWRKIVQSIGLGHEEKRHPSIILGIGMDVGSKTTDLVTIDQYRETTELPTMETVIGRKKNTREAICFGAKALEFDGRDPEMETIWPISGTIQDFEVANSLFAELASQSISGKKHNLETLVVSVPFGDDEVTQNHCARIRGLVNRYFGAKKVFLVPQTVLAALGQGLPILKREGVCLVDIGGGTTQFLVISYGKIIAQKSVNFAGNHVDQQIADHLKRTFGILVTHTEAELIKMEFCEDKITGSTYDFLTHMIGQAKPTSVKIPVAGIKEIIDRATKDIANMIVTELMNLAQDSTRKIVRDIVENFIVLTGGGAQLRDLDTVIQEESNYAVKRGEDPQSSVSRGLKEILLHPELFELLEIKGTPPPSIMMKFRRSLARIISPK